MNFTELISIEIESAFKATEGLIKKLDKDKLGWKPTSGNNWMTNGQLLKHISEACGAGFKGFVTGDWGFPADFDPSKMSEEDMLPPAEKLPTLSSVDEALKELAADKTLAYEMLKTAGEDNLHHKMVSPPWNPVKMPLGFYLLQMVAHLNSHKSQLFYYLKLQGKSVNTGDLWGM